jgi:hypothetical protein
VVTQGDSRLIVGRQRDEGMRARPEATIASPPAAIRASRRGRQMLGWLEDAALSLLFGLASPLSILVVGTPSRSCAAC